MNEFIWKSVIEVEAGNLQVWHPAHMLTALFDYLKDRQQHPTVWLNDNAKYINIRFDSRTGSFIVNDDFNQQYLIWE